MQRTSFSAAVDHSTATVCILLSLSKGHPRRHALATPEQERAKRENVSRRGERTSSTIIDRRFRGDNDSTRFRLSVRCSSLPSAWRWWWRRRGERSTQHRRGHHDRCRGCRGLREGGHCSSVGGACYTITPVTDGTPHMHTIVGIATVPVDSAPFSDLFRDDIRRTGW